MNLPSSVARARNSARVYRAAVYTAAGITAFVLLFLVGYILFKGIGYLSPSLFAFEYNSVNVSLLPSLINTVFITLLSLFIAIPLGVLAAIYLVEYANRGNRYVAIIRVTAETLSGIPSIVYGLFGMLFFVMALKFGLSLLSGSLTLSIMVLPLILRTTEEALISVPDAYREGSFALGAGRLRTVLRIVLPSAVPGILAGVILSIGRIVGETAALLYTAGTVARIPQSVMDSTRTLSAHMYVLSNEGFHVNEAYATAVVLLILVLLINTASAMIARRVTKGRGIGNA
jgi:phosphate transport system permease protein